LVFEESFEFSLLSKKRCKTVSKELGPPAHNNAAQAIVVGYTVQESLFKLQNPKHSILIITSGKAL
jgi:hypothetical protein